MKLRRFSLKLFLAVVTWAVFSQVISAQTLREAPFKVGTEAEAFLDLTASAPHTSWAEAGSEAAVATVLVDGRYNQDVFLFAGERRFTYRVLLGRFQPGEHILRIDLNRKRSASKAATVEIQDAKISFVVRGSTEYQALSLPHRLCAAKHDRKVHRYPTGHVVRDRESRTANHFSLQPDLYE